MWEHCHLCWFIFICFQSRFLLCSHFSICSHPWPLSPHSTSNPAKPRLALSLPCAQGLTVSPTASIIILLHSHLLPALFQQPPKLSLCFCPCPPKLLPCFPHSSQCDPFKTDSDHMSPFFQPFQRISVSTPAYVTCHHPDPSVFWSHLLPILPGPQSLLPIYAYRAPPFALVAKPS